MQKSLGGVDGAHGVICVSGLSEHVEQRKYRSTGLYGGESGICVIRLCGYWGFCTENQS